MVLQVKLRQKTTSLVKIFIWTELKTWQRMKKHAIVLADDDTHIIRSQSSQSKKLNLLTWSDLAFGFVNKRSAWVRDGISYLLNYELELSKSWVWVEVELSLSYQKMPFSPFLFLFLVFSAFLWLVLETTPLQGKRNIVHGRMLLRALFTCSVRVKSFDLLVIQT